MNFYYTVDSMNSGKTHSIGNHPLQSFYYSNLIVSIQKINGLGLRGQFFFSFFENLIRWGNSLTDMHLALKIKKNNSLLNHNCMTQIIMTLSSLFLRGQFHLRHVTPGNREDHGK